MALEVRVLGELQVRRDGSAVQLPRSKKTRALLAYLALEAREHRRDRLTRLLWDVTDDPRGALRWSLCKLRKVVDGSGCKRVVATRSHVTLADAELDLRRLEVAARAGLDAQATDALFRLMGEGELLEGMDLPDFADFEAWLQAQRARATGLRVRVLQELARRDLDSDAALRVARTWALLAPDDDEARVYLARQQRPRRAAPSPTLAPPGRSDDLAWLWTQQELVEREGRARVAIVEAAPGLGKTTLIDAFAASLDGEGLVVLRGCGYEAARGRPLGLWDELFPGPDAPVDDTVADTAARLRHLARDEVATVIVDDAHLADPSSALVLRAAARMRGRLLVVLAARPAELTDNVPLQQVLDELGELGRVHRLTLEPLDDAVLHSLVDARLDEAARRSILARSGGNPLFVRELSRARSEAVDGEGDLGRTVRLRMVRLGEPMQVVLQWAAVLDQGAWDTLAVVSGSSDLAHELELAERYGFLLLDVQTRSFRWSHALLRDAVVASVSALRQVEMHAAAVDVLEAAEADPGRLAYHAERSGSPDRAASVSLEAARRCALRGGVPETVHHCRRALTFSAQLSRRRRVEIEIGATILLLQVDRTEAADPTIQLERLAMEALELEAHHAARDAFFTAGSLRWETGGEDIAATTRQSYLAGTLTRETTDAVSPARAAYCLALLEEDFPRIDALIHEADGASRRSGAIPPELALARGLLAQHRGNGQAAQESFTDARLLAKASGAPLIELHALELAARLAYARNDGPACRAAALAASDVAQKVREGGELPVVLALVALLDGDDDQVARHVGELEQLDDKRRLAYLHARWALRRTGLEAETCADRAIALGAEIDAPSDRAIATAIGLARAAARRDDEAYGLLEEQLATLETEHVLSHEAQTIIATSTRGDDREQHHAHRPR